MSDTRSSLEQLSAARLRRTVFRARTALEMTERLHPENIAGREKWLRYAMKILDMTAEAAMH